MAQEPDGQQPSLEEMEAELTRLRAELDHYQQLIEQTPSIYEEKYRHRVREVALDIRRLLDEEQDLKQQVDQALAGGRAQADLPPAASPPLQAEPSEPFEPAPDPSAAPTLLQRLPRQRWLLFVAVAVAVALATAILGTLLRGARQPAPQAAPEAQRGEPPSVPAGPGNPPASEPAGAPALRLRARGDCWLHVQTLAGESLLLDTLQAGEERRLPLGEGLRLLAGRPDLLEVAVGEGDYRTHGTISQIDWVTIRPPAAAQGSSAQGSS
jgi:hypothetical protein